MLLVMLSGENERTFKLLICDMQGRTNEVFKHAHPWEETKVRN